MGVDVTLMPLLSPSFWTAHTMRDLERRRELWDSIAELQQQEIPQPLHCYKSHNAQGETCYGPVETDPYGGRLKWLKAETLLALCDHEGVQDNWQNKAVWAYLAELPPDWPIVVYWH